MSIYTTDSVKQAAERIGIRNLKPEITDALARDVQYRIHEIVQEAVKFMRHSKRVCLNTSDINRALRVKNVEPIYGYAQSSEYARQFRRVQVGGGSSSSAASASTQAVYYAEEEELDIEALLKAPLPPAPAELEFTAHWLAVEGVQPAIPQNPPPSEAHKDLLAKKIRLETASMAELEAANAERDTGKTAVNTGVAPMDTDEVGGMHATTSNAKEAANKAASGDRSNVSGATTDLQASGSTANGTPAKAADMDALASVEVKPAVKHVLSREMRMYYERVVTAIFPDEDIPIENQEVGAKPTIAEEKIRLRDAALTSLAEDPGLHQLLPYLIQCVLDKITRNLRRLDVLTAALSTLNALLSNNNLFVEPYLHQLMPGIITCMVTRRLGVSPLEPHWTLRANAAQLCARICARYGRQYHTLQPRVARTLLRAFLDPAKPLTTQYGAIKGLAALGHQVIQHLLLPNTRQYGALIEPALLDERNERRQEAEMCRGAMLDALVELARAESARIAAEETKRDTDMDVDIQSSEVQQVAETLNQRLGSLFANGITERLPASQGGVAQWRALIAAIP